MRLGRRTLAAKSVSDPPLDNPNPDRVLEGARI
jgi:hypothetical protein